MDEIRFGGVVSFAVGIMVALIKFIQWLVSAALDSAEKSNDRLEEEVSRAYDAAREARSALHDIQIQLGNLERENSLLQTELALLKAEKQVMQTRLDRFESQLNGKME